MALRPQTARWFQLMIERGELAVVLKCLAETGAVELQAHGDSPAATLLPTLRAAVDEFKQMRPRYSPYWPQPFSAPAQREREAEEISTSALKQLRSWAISANPIIDRMQKLTHERQELEPLEQLLHGTGSDLPDSERFVHAGPVLASRAYLLAPQASAQRAPTSVLLQKVTRDDLTYVLALGSTEQIAAFDNTLGASKARRLGLPSGLPAGRGAAHAFLCALIAQNTRESRSLESKLQELHRQHGLAAALADMSFIGWLVHNVLQLELSEHFAWITGWTSDASGSRLEAALARPHLHFLLRFPEAPQDMIPPLILRNPRWAQPFEVFLRLLGMPGASGADPSRLLAFVAPLMFGYMFADVGQGALLVVAGAALRKRFPATVLLVSGGCAAIVFGFLFGSVFAREDIVPDLWLRPLARPLFLLGMSLAFGACLLLLGLCLDAVQYLWSGRGALWLVTRAGLLLSYLGMVFAAVDGRMLWAVAAGTAWYLTGSAAVTTPGKRATALGTAAGESLETLLQLAINTVSFVRVGAFALAHAGLCSAFAAVAAATDSRPVAWLVLAFGNALIIVIEGLVVGIQTTRLVLFEFFVRFLQSSGRSFRPLLTPTVARDLYPSSRTSP